MYTEGQKNVRKIWKTRVQKRRFVQPPSVRVVVRLEYELLDDAEVETVETALN